MKKCFLNVGIFTIKKYQNTGFPCLNDGKPVKDTSQERRGNIEKISDQSREVCRYGDQKNHRHEKVYVSNDYHSYISSYDIPGLCGRAYGDGCGD